MAIPEEIRDYVSGLIDYYVSTASSYREMAGAYGRHAGSVEDAAFGMIAGSVYSGFMQMYQSQKITPSLEEINEFNAIMLKKAPDIRKAVAAKG